MGYVRLPEGMAHPQHGCIPAMFVSWPWIFGKLRNQGWGESTCNYEMNGTWSVELDDLAWQTGRSYRGVCPCISILLVAYYIHIPLNVQGDLNWFEELSVTLLVVFDRFANFWGCKHKKAGHILLHLVARRISWDMCSFRSSTSWLDLKP